MWKYVTMNMSLDFDKIHSSTSKTSTSNHDIWRELKIRRTEIDGWESRSLQRLVAEIFRLDNRQLKSFGSVSFHTCMKKKFWSKYKRILKWNTIRHINRIQSKLNVFIRLWYPPINSCRCFVNVFARSSRALRCHDVYCKMLDAQHDTSHFRWLISLTSHVMSIWFFIRFITEAFWSEWLRYSFDK